MMMASPDRTSTIELLVVGEKELILKDLVEFSDKVGAVSDNDGDDGDDDDNKPKHSTESDDVRKPLTKQSFEEIFGRCHTVILPDGMFTTKSEIFHTENFIELGLPSLVELVYQRDGGTVIVMSTEGIHLSTEGVKSSVSEINKLFGTNWKFKFFESNPVGPTDAGGRVFGPYTPQLVELSNGPSFLQIQGGTLEEEEEQEEGLYRKIMNDRETFERTFKEGDESK